MAVWLYSMTVVQALQEAISDSHIRRAVKDAYEAELNGDPMQNGKRRDVDASKNTHFEFQFGGDADPEVYAYIERYDSEPGIEVMLWADDGWFDNEAFEGYGPDIEDGGKTLAEFADILLDIVADVIESDAKPQFEYYQSAPPSVVFSAVFYL